MATHSPTVTLYPTGVVTIASTDSTSYASILQSLGSMNYVILSVYLQANSLQQILQELGFFKYDVNGNIVMNQVIPTADPYQLQHSLNLDFKDKGYVLDGKISIQYTVLPNEVVNLVITNLSVGNKDLLDGGDSFDQEFLERNGFFDSYTKKLC